MQSRAATSASIADIHGIAIDGSGNVYIADTANSRVRKIDTSGKITTFAGSYGSSFLKASSGSGKIENTLISAGIYHQATKSLKIVGEGDYAWSKLSPAGGTKKNKSFTGAFGLMLFY